MNDNKVEKAYKVLKRKYRASTSFPESEKQMKQIEVHNHKNLLKPCSVILKKWKIGGTLNEVQDTVSDHIMDQINDSKKYENTLENCVNLNDCDSFGSKIQSKTVEIMQHDSSGDIDDENRVISRNSHLVNSVEGHSFGSAPVANSSNASISSGENKHVALSQAKAIHDKPSFSEKMEKSIIYNTSGGIKFINKHASSCDDITSNVDTLTDENDCSKDEAMYKCSRNCPYKGNKYSVGVCDCSYESKTKTSPCNYIHREPLTKENDCKFKNNLNSLSDSYYLKPCSVVLDKIDYIDYVRKSPKSNNVSSKISGARTFAKQNYLHRKTGSYSNSRTNSIAKEKYLNSKNLKVRRKQIGVSFTSSCLESCTRPDRSYKSEMESEDTSSDDESYTKPNLNYRSEIGSENDRLKPSTSFSKLHGKKHKDYLTFNEYMRKHVFSDVSSKFESDYEGIEAMMNANMSKICRTESSENSESDEQSMKSMDQSENANESEINKFSYNEDSEDDSDVSIYSNSVSSYNKKYVNIGTQTAAVEFIESKAEPSTSSEAVSESIGPKYIFRSQLGKKYVVDYFESGNIRKLYVTVNCREESNSTREHNQCEQNTKTPITLSEVLTSFRTFDKQNYEIVAKNPYMHTLFSMLSAEKEDRNKLVLSSSEKEKNSLPSSSNDSVDKIRVISEGVHVSGEAFIPVCKEGLAEEKIAVQSRGKLTGGFVKELTRESEKEVISISDSDLTAVSKNELMPKSQNDILESEGEIVSVSDNEDSFEPEKNSVQESEKEVFTLSDSSLNSPNEKSDRYCVQCYYKFLNTEDNYNHTCAGKREKGFLCIYCEKIFPSYKKLNSHKQMHLNS